jgi:hypothetical protein
VRPVGNLAQESNAGHSRRVPMLCPSEFSRPTCNFPVERIDKPADNKTLWCLAAATDAISRLMIRRLGEGARSYWLGLISAGRRSQRPHLFHFSLRSRCTATLAGLQTLIRTGHGQISQRISCA